MTLTRDLKWFYGIGLLFIITCCLAIAFDFYYIWALPVIPIIGYFVFYKTEQLFYFLAFATPLSIPVRDIGGGIGLSLPTEPIIFLLFAGVLFKLIGGLSFNKKLITHPLTIIILLDVLWMVITSISSSMPMVSAKYTLARSWFVVVFYLALAQLFEKRKASITFLWCFSISTTVLTLYTLKNHAAESFTRLYSYTAMRPFLPDHGMYAAAISFAIPVMLVLFFYGRRMRLKWFSISLAAILGGIIVVGVIFSFTRASWLSLVVAIGVWGLLRLRVKFKTVATLGILGAAVLLLFQSVIWQELARNKQDSDDDLEDHVQSFSNVSTDPSNLERLNRWSCAYRMFLDKPLVGFGPGTFTYQYAPYQISSEMSIISTHSGDLGNVHSEYLRPLAESGLVSGILFLLMVIVALNLGFDVYYSCEDPYFKYLALGALLGLVTYFSHGFLNNYSDFDKIPAPMWGFMAILISIKVFHLKPKQEIHLEA